MANPKRIYLYVNEETGKFVDIYGKTLSSQDWLKMFLNEKQVILCLTFRTAALVASVFNETDTFDIAIDTDYVKSIQNAQLNAGLTGAITIIPVKSCTETPALTGTVRLTNTAGDTEDVPYTSYTLALGVYSLVVSVTLDHTYLADDEVVFLEPLMIYADNSKVNISGDWTAASKSGGKLSFRIACNTDESEEKLGADDEIEVICEARKYIAGQDSIILQDGAKFHNIINDGSPSPSINDPLYRLAAAQDSIDNLMARILSGTQATLTDDATTNINVFDKTTAGSAVIALDIIGAAGRWTYPAISLNWFGATASVMLGACNENGTIAGTVTIDADISSNNVRLNITLAGVGANLKAVHRILQTTLET